MRRLHLYLGAHKTATTHLQGILLANRSTLRNRGVALSAPQDLRSEWLPRFFRYCNSHTDEKDEEALHWLRSQEPPEDLWIVTEENIIGVSNDFALKPGMYPMAAERMRCLVEIFPAADIRFFFSVRSYETFYRSAYSEVVRNRGYLPFERFYDYARFKHNSWHRMLGDIAAVISAEKMTVWKYEDFGELLDQLVCLLTMQSGSDDLIHEYKADLTRPSLSFRTMEILASLDPVLTRQESRALVERINRAYSIEKGFGPYSPFSPTEETELRQRYLQDLDSVRTNFPGIRFLAP